MQMSAISGVFRTTRFLSLAFWKKSVARYTQTTSILRPTTYMILTIADLFRTISHKVNEQVLVHYQLSTGQRSYTVIIIIFLQFIIIILQWTIYGSWVKEQSGHLKLIFLASSMVNPTQTQCDHFSHKSQLSQSLALGWRHSRAKIQCQNRWNYIFGSNRNNHHCHLESEKVKIATRTLCRLTATLSSDSLDWCIIIILWLRYSYIHTM